jgi:RHS repeat-associated protein
MTSEWQAHTGLVSTTTTPRVQYAYSQGVGGNHSRLTRITYPDGYQVNYAYTAGIDAAVSRPTSLSGLQAGSTAAVTLEAFKYLGAGTVIERSRPEVNVTLSMVNFSGATADAGDKYTGLDRFGRVADQRWTQGTTATSPVLDRYGYTYDRNSNRLTRSNALAAAFSETYAYDALNQLQSFSRGGTATPTTSQQWQFDALGNWTTVTTDGVANTPRTVNAQNELTQASGKTLTYTPTGSMGTDVQGRTFTYDAWNRLVSVKNATGTEVARYEYDGLARRIVERVGTLAAPAAATAPVRDVYYSQNWQVLEERLRTPAGAIPTTADTRFVWSPVYVDAMVVRDRNADGNTTTGTGGLEERVYALQDANWNTTAIIAAAGVPGVAAGAVVNRFIYAPYGRSDVLTAAWATAGASTPTPWAHRFQGLEFTDVTNLFHARNRDYSFALGRFIQLDPIGFSAGDNNWYRFVGNGPTGKVDPSGLEPVIAVSGAHNSHVTGSTSLPSPYTLLNDFGAAPSPEEVQRRLDGRFPSPSTQGDLWADNRTPHQRYRSELHRIARYGKSPQECAAAIDELYFGPPPEGVTVADLVHTGRDVTIAIMSQGRRCSPAGTFARRGGPAAKGLPGVDGKPIRSWESNTSPALQKKGQKHIETNESTADFVKKLEDSGFSSSQTSSGATQLTNPKTGVTYTVKPQSRTGPPTAYRNDGTGQTHKIRLGQDR